MNEQRHAPGYGIQPGSRVDYLESLRDGVVVLGPDMRVRYVNERYYSQFGLTPGDIGPGDDLKGVYRMLLAKRLMECPEGSSEDAFIADILATYREKIGGVERRFLPDGRIIDIYRSMTTGDDVVTVHVDVTRSVRSEEEAERNRQHMVSLLHNTTDGMGMLDEAGRFVMYNDRFLELYDIRKKDVHWGMHYDELLEEMGDLKHLSIEERRLAIADRRTFAFDDDVLTVRRRLKNGRTLHVAKTLLEGGGSVMTIRDMTEDLRREEELTYARQLAEKSNRSKSEFVARMSHEMRTPLNGILGVSALLAETEMASRQKELLDVVSASGKVLLRLIDDILDLSRIDAETFEVVEAPFCLRELIEQCIETVVPSALDKGLEVRSDRITLPDRQVIGDMVRIKQVLLNLLTNAVKFTERGHIELEVDARVHGDMVAIRFAVADTGVGIEKDKYARIFDRFYQIDGTITRRYGGAGLGLAITRKLMEAMGGTIELASEPGLGSVFTVRLSLPALAQGGCESVHVRERPHEA